MDHVQVGVTKHQPKAATCVAPAQTARLVDLKATRHFINGSTRRMFLSIGGEAEKMRIRSCATAADTDLRRVRPRRCHSRFVGKLRRVPRSPPGRASRI